MHFLLTSVGDGDGRCVGVAVGAVSAELGAGEGAEVSPTFVGLSVGAVLGVRLGCCVGVPVGACVISMRSVGYKSWVQSRRQSALSY